MWKYIIPVVISIIVSLFMYFISVDEKKNSPDKIIFRNVFPGIIVGLLVFIIIKYKAIYEGIQYARSSIKPSNSLIDSDDIDSSSLE